MRKKNSAFFYIAAIIIAAVITFQIFKEVRARHIYQNSSEAILLPPPEPAPIEPEKIPDSLVQQLLPNMRYLLSYCDTIQNSGILDKVEYSEEDKQWLLTQEVRFKDSILVFLNYPVGIVLSHNITESVDQMHSMFKRYDYESFPSYFQQRKEILEEALIPIVHAER